MQTTPERRILVIANRTAATPRVLEAVRRLASEQPSVFALLIPDAPHSKHTDWTLDRALPYLERAAGGPVEGLTGTSGDPFDAIRDVVANGQYDLILVSTLPKATSRWLRRDIPKRIESLGVPVEVITPAGPSMAGTISDAARTGLPG